MSPTLRFWSAPPMAMWLSLLLLAREPRQQGHELVVLLGQVVRPGLVGVVLAELLLGGLALVGCLEVLVGVGGRGAHDAAHVGLAGGRVDPTAAAGATVGMEVVHPHLLVLAGRVAVLALLARYHVHLAGLGVV